MFWSCYIYLHMYIQIHMKSIFFHIVDDCWYLKCPDFPDRFSELSVASEELILQCMSN